MQLLYNTTLFNNTISFLYLIISNTDNIIITNINLQWSQMKRKTKMNQMRYQA